LSPLFIATKPVRDGGCNRESSYGSKLLYQEETAGGEPSNFNKLMGRETAEAREHGESRASRHHGRR
jgi:hypothetical protein